MNALLLPFLVLSAIGFATLYSAIQRPQMLQDRKCPNGHAVSVSDTYCPACGRSLS
jgi:hypothetical protein